MTDKESLEEKIVNMMMCHLPDANAQDLRMELQIILQPYHVEQHKTELVVYEGDKNVLMMERFFSAKLAKGLSIRTIKFYKQSLTHFFRRVGKPYDEITPDDIRLYLALRIQRDKISKTAANNERRNVSSFYGWLQKEEIMMKNPMTKVDPIKETKQKKKAYELMDLEKIRMGCRTARERCMVEMLASTWCRVSELVNIKTDEVCDGVVTVHGKGDKYRDVYLNARAQLALELYMKERRDENPYIFPRAEHAGDIVKLKADPEWYKNADLVSKKDHMDHSSVEGIIRRIGKRVGIENVHPHRFRRTGATMALRAGMPITDVQKILGHSNIETTQIYLDISDDELREAHKKFVT